MSFDLKQEKLNPYENQDVIDILNEEFSLADLGTFEDYLKQQLDYEMRKKTVFEKNNMYSVFSEGFVEAFQCEIRIEELKKKLKTIKRIKK